MVSNIVQTGGALISTGINFRSLPLIQKTMDNEIHCIWPFKDSLEQILEGFLKSTEAICICSKKAQRLGHELGHGLMNVISMGF